MNISKSTGLALFVAGSLFLGSCSGGAKSGKEDQTAADTSKTQNNAVTPQGNLNYAFGVLAGSSLKNQLGLTLNEVKSDELTNAVKAVLDGKKSKKELQDGMAFSNKEAMRLMELKKTGGANPKNISPKFAEAVGILFGNNLKGMGITISDFNEGDYLKGYKAAMGEGTLEMDEQTAQLVVQNQATKMKEAMSQRNLEEGKKFLEENMKKNPKLKTTASGMQYEVIKAGSGAKPTAADKVTTHYHGTLIDGSVFDSSVERGEPIEFALSGVIKGWTEILQLMPKGSKWRVYIPSDLAYGPQGSPGGIGPNATLIFEIELFKINGK